MKLLRTACITLLGITLLTGCSDSQKWNAKNISGLMPPLEFNLTDESGKAVTASDYRGKISMLFFGYTHCPDYCPTTLSKLARVLANIPDEREKVRVLFVSVDPNRDSPENLAIYTSNFAPEVIGLTGKPADLRELAKRYRTTFSYGDGYPEGNYIVSHGLAVYVFDPEGNARIMMLNTETVPKMTQDLKQLLALSGTDD